MQANTTCHISPTKLLPISPRHDRIPAGRALATAAAAASHVPQAISISTLEGRSMGVSVAEVEEDRVAAFWDYQFLFVSQRSEAAKPVVLHAVDGAVPPDFPSGTYYLIGPGLFADDHGSTVHPLDGHGYLRGFVFGGSPEGKEVGFMARYVKTEAQVEEHDPVSDTWRFTHRGPFSVLKGGRKVGNTKVMKNVANTSVVKWGGKLLCLWEGGDPYEIEPGSLNTVGKLEMIDGQGEPEHGGIGDVWDVAASFLKPILYGVFKMPAKRMLSHYKVDARKDRLLTLSCNAEDMLLPRSNFTFYEFDSNFKLLQEKEFNIPDHLMIHDWAFTDTHYILFGNRIKLDVPGSISAVCGISPMISALSVDPSKSTSPIYLLPRSQHEGQKGRDWRSAIEVPAQLWLLHFGNAFEAVDEEEGGTREIRLQACVCSYEWFNFHKLFGYNWQSGKLDPSIMNVKQDGKALLPHLVQVSIDIDAEGDCRKCSVEPLNDWTRPTDFPVINPDFSGRKNKYIYGGTTSGTRPALPHFPFDSVVKLNLSDGSSSTWSTGNRRFIGEPIFVSKGTGEDDGYILVVEYAVSIQRCYLVILNPKRIGEADALAARLEVPKEFNFPLGFHGFWDVDS